jgi:hypothetical protein
VPIFGIAGLNRWRGRPIEVSQHTIGMTLIAMSIRMTRAVQRPNRLIAKN